jgi:hypothetical protein
MKYLLAIALPFFMLGLLLWAPHSTQQLGTLVEIHGRVLYPNGEVARGAMVFAFKEGRLTSRVPSGNSDDQGRFIIKRLENGVEYELCSSKQEEGHLLPYGLPFGLSTGGQCKNVTAGAASEIIIVLAPKSGTLEGEVREARNRNAISKGKVILYRPLKFLRGTWVLVNPLEATWTPTAEATISDHGHFRILGLPTGSYFLKVEVHGHKAWYFSNQVSDTAAQPISIQGGLTRKIVVHIP